jgi:hypothetical protein
MPADRTRVQAIFDQAVSCTADGRGALLDEACRGDHELRAEVQSLLDAHDRALADDFLGEPAVRLAQTLLARDEGEELPDRIGPYVIEAELGRGGMGIVYLAEDPRLGRKVALKALAPEFTADEARRSRLRVEARAAAALSHPGIATVYTLEEFGGQLCMVSEYVEGQTLRSLIQRGPVPAAALVDYAEQIGRALGAAHAIGIVHRDLKPENVVISVSGQVKILDFGIARLAAPVGDGPRRLTEAGTIVGTPGYMAPEQLEGQDADARSDMFSLGVLLYESATGDHPFEGTTAMATALRVLEHDPPPLAAMNPLLPRGLDRVVRKCLQKAPGDRYQAASDLVADLDGAGHRERRRPPASGSAASSSLSYRGVWRVHQAGVMLVYGALVYPLWVAVGAGGGWPGAVFFTALAAAVLNGTLRFHLLFTERFDRQDTVRELRSAGPWIRRSDVVYSACLVAGAALAAGGSAPLAGLLGGVGIGAAATSLIVEPSTTRSAFGRKVSGIGRRTPSRERS